MKRLLFTFAVACTLFPTKAQDTLTLGQLKILQEVIALSVFVPFSVFYMKESLSWNYLYAAICIAGAVFFIFRG